MEPTTHEDHTVANGCVMPAPPALEITGITARVQPGVPTTALRSSRDFGVSIGDLVGEQGNPSLALVASSPSEFIAWLDGLRDTVLAAFPEADPEPGPDPLLAQVRELLVEDTLRCLGVPEVGPAREIDELLKSDIRGARNATQRAVDLLDALLYSDDLPAPARSADGPIGRAA